MSSFVITHGLKLFGMSRTRGLSNEQQRNIFPPRFPVRQEYLKGGPSSSQPFQLSVGCTSQLDDGGAGYDNYQAHALGVKWLALLVKNWLV